MNKLHGKDYSIVMNIAWYVSYNCLFFSNRWDLIDCMQYKSMKDQAIYLFVTPHMTANVPKNDCNIEQYNTFKCHAQKSN